jgi:5-(carboxyamino)imidazole ribonucleotide synthase
VLKTADFGYDGKGQLKIENAESDYDAIWNNLGYSVGVLEQWVDYQTELSIIVAANGLGEFKTFPLTENIHRNHILHMSIAPARVPPVVQAKAHDLACEIANSLQCVGLLAVEMFLCKDGNLLVNELAPRPHNSGHWTLDACATSQFEQHIRAVCGMPLGLCDSLKPAVMVNILGDAWHGERSPNWVKLLKNPGTNLHLYDKGEPRIARKMGHFTVLNNDLGEAIEHASCIFREMGAGSSAIS